MNRSRKNPLALVLLVAGLLMAVGAAPALASPAGDEDSAFNAQGAAFDNSTFDTDFGVSPLTTQDPVDKTVLAVNSFCSVCEGGGIHIARFTTGGQPVTSFGDNGSTDITFNGHADRLLDIRALADGTIYVLYADNGRLQWLSIDRDGDPSDAGGFIDPGDTCGSPIIDAARVEANGHFAALWDCTVVTATDNSLHADVIQQAKFLRIRRVDPSPSALLASKDYFDLAGGVDVELGPNGSVFGLAGANNQNAIVIHMTSTNGDDLNIDGNYGGQDNTVRTIGDLPIDLAVDSSGRALVWTAPPTNTLATATPWFIHRLQASGAPDNTWGTNSVVKLDDDQLGDPVGSDYPMLLARSDGKVLVSGPDSEGSSQVIARLLGNGHLDSAWATGGYKHIAFGGSKTYRFGSIFQQADLKTLLAFIAQDFDFARSFGAPPEGTSLGVGRLREGVPASRRPAGSQGGVAGASAKGSVCGRRAISLVRAFSRGGKVELQGLVGSAYYSKKVTIYASSGHGFRKIRTTKATRTGTFKARVRRPRGRSFITIRYIAKAGKSKSPVLKLPQSLKSTSIKERAGKITVKGHVKRALVGSRRNKVKIQRLVCGHYKTVGSARPTRGGRYVVTFNKPLFGGVAYFRARGVVLNKPHGHRYVVQYARAIRIKLTAQTG